MKIEYKVLWFEDQFESMEGYFERLQELVRSQGFIPEFTHRGNVTQTGIEELSYQLNNYNPYDLIIFDCDLGAESSSGLDIAAGLRRRIYTDMIFYSGKAPTELRKLLYEHKIDGVFIVHRDNFYDEIEPIVDAHIKKMSDLNNLRGVVMASTSEMDIQLRENLISKLKSLNEKDGMKCFSKAKKKLKESFSGRTSKIDGIESLDDLITVIKDPRIVDFNRVRLIFFSACDEVEGKTLLEDNEVLHQVINKRNDLAHQKAVLQDGKMTLGTETYDHAHFIEVRKDLLAAKSAVDKLSTSPTLPAGNNLDRQG